MSNAANQNGSGLEQQVRKKKGQRKDEALFSGKPPANPFPPPSRTWTRSRGFSPTGNLQRGWPFSLEDAQRGISFIRSNREMEREREREHHGPSSLVGQLVTYATYNGGKRFRERHASCRVALALSFSLSLSLSFFRFLRDRIARGRELEGRARIRVQVGFSWNLIEMTHTG